MARPQRVSRKRNPDEVLATGVITKTVPATLLERLPIEEGTEVRVARIIKTPVGLRFRIFGTIRWVPEDSISCDFDRKHVVDYTKHLEKSHKSKSPSQFGDAKIPKGLKPYKELDITKSVSGMRPALGRKTKMESKKDLKSFITGLTTGDKVTVTYLSVIPSDTRYDSVRSLAGQTVEYTLVETKKGRGKGGSQLMVLQPTAGGDRVTTGTPHSEAILSVTGPDGVLVGHESEADVPKSYETNAGNASTLKTAFQDLVGTTGARVRLTSTEDEFSGDFTVTGAEQLRGRHGQVRLTLTADDGRETKVWSYRHSGVVTGFEVLSTGTPVTTETTETATEA